MLIPSVSQCYQQRVYKTKEPAIEAAKEQPKETGRAFIVAEKKSNCNIVATQVVQENEND